MLRISPKELRLKGLSADAHHRVLWWNKPDRGDAAPWCVQPWRRNGSQEWDATGIPLRNSLHWELYLHSWASCTEQIGCLSWLRACSWVYLYMKLRSVRGESPWMHGEGHILPLYVKSKQRRQPLFTLLLGKPDATNLEWAKGNSHWVYFILWPKFWDMEEKHSADSKKLVNLRSRLSPFEQSRVIPLPSAAIPGFSTYSPWLNMDSAAVLGRIMITRDNLHVSRNIADRTQKEMPSLTHSSKSIS